MHDKRKDCCTQVTGKPPQTGQQGRRQNTQFHGFCVTVSGRFGWRHALCRESSDAQRGADAGFFQQKDEASENAGLL
jgi:hypothetical protein